MKNKFTNTVVVLAYFMLMTTLGIVAAVPSKVDRSEKEKARNEIIRTVTAPSFYLEEGQPDEVRVHLAVMEDGSVKVLAINSANEQLKDFVLTQLKDLKVTESSKLEPFILVIKFKNA